MWTGRFAAIAMLAVVVAGPAAAASCDPAARNNPAFADARPGEAWCIPAAPVVRAEPRPGCPDQPGKTSKAADNAIYNDGETSITVSGAVAVDISTGRIRPHRSHHRTDLYRREADARRCD